jgi:hypothetical protein
MYRLVSAIFSIPKSVVLAKLPKMIVMMRNPKDVQVSVCHIQYT